MICNVIYDTATDVESTLGASLLIKLQYVAQERMTHEERQAHEPIFERLYGGPRIPGSGFEQLHRVLLPTQSLRNNDSVNNEDLHRNHRYPVHSHRARVSVLFRTVRSNYYMITRKDMDDEERTKRKRGGRY